MYGAVTCFILSKLYLWDRNNIWQDGDVKSVGKEGAFQWNGTVGIHLEKIKWIFSYITHS